MRAVIGEGIVSPTTGWVFEVPQGSQEEGIIMRIETHVKQQAAALLRLLYYHRLLIMVPRPPWGYRQGAVALVSNCGETTRRVDCLNWALQHQLGQCLDLGRRRVGERWVDMANPRWWVRVMRGGAKPVQFEPLPEQSHPVAALARKKMVG